MSKPFRKFLLAFILTFLSISLASAEATNVKMLLGYWGAVLPNGKGVLYHFTPTKMTASYYGESKEFVAEAFNANVKYKPFSKMPGTDQSIGIEFDNGGGFLAVFKDKYRVYLNFMGAAADEPGNPGGHFLVRLSEKPPHRPITERSSGN